MSKSAAALHDVLDERIAALLANEGVVSVDLQELVDASVSAAIVRSTATLLGFSGKDAAEIATSAAELASNAVLHAGGGSLDVHCSPELLVITVIDRGKGSAAVVRERLRGATARAESDGLPSPLAPTITTGLGLGLGAVARLMCGVAVEERDGGGLLVRAWKRRAVTEGDVDGGGAAA